MSAKRDEAAVRCQHSNDCFRADWFSLVLLHDPCAGCENSLQPGPRQRAIAAVVSAGNDHEVSNDLLVCKFLNVALT